MSNKPINISKHLVWEAYKRVKRNKGSAGVDEQTLEDFDQDLKGNLYKLWNRLSSGSYFPPAVKRVEIPKKSGGKRPLGIPTVSDRIAQMVVKMQIEPALESVFHENSYGYRPNKAALDAVSITRKRCWKYDWVVEFDIKGAFDNVDHALLMKSVKHHFGNRWFVLYIDRWLKVPSVNSEGKIISRTKGVPQGGVVSPILMNLFMHYAFDTWMVRNHRGKPFVRYADDGLVHCRSLEESKTVMKFLRQRFQQCGMEIHPDKSGIVYCKDANRKQQWKNVKFTFLGYTFQPRGAKDKKGRLFLSFLPAASIESKRSLRQKIRKWAIHRQSQHSLEELAKLINPVVRGWFNYFGKFNQATVIEMSYYLNNLLSKWARKKFRKLRYRKRESAEWVKRTAKSVPHLFAHWKYYAR